MNKIVEDMIIASTLQAEDKIQDRKKCVNHRFLSESLNIFSSFNCGMWLFVFANSCTKKVHLIYRATCKNIML